MIIAWVWTLAALYGVVIGISSMRIARWRLDQLNLQRLNGLREIEARRLIRSETGRLVVQLVFVVLGAGVIFGVDGIRSLTGIALVTAEVVMVINTRLDRSDSDKLVKEVRATEIAVAKRLMGQHIDQEKEDM